MATETPREPTRRVVAGFSEAGRSTIAVDGDATAWVRRPGGSIIEDLWQVASLPTHVAEDDGLGEKVGLAPPHRGAVIRTCLFPPESSMDLEAFREAMVEVYGERNIHGEDEAHPGMHSTDTVDIVTVLSGELFVVMEEGETLLRQGDIFVQRGGKHAWSNRSERPAKVLSLMMGADGA